MKEDSKEADNIKNKCTTVCQESNCGVSCSKIMLVDIFNKNNPSATCRVYAIIDDQSNTSLISNELADMFGIDSCEKMYYLSTCSSAKEVTYGRRVSGLVARSVVNNKESLLPTLIECDNIPTDKGEIPTPNIAKRFKHLQDIADEIPPLDNSAGVHLLIGRDAPEMLKVRAFKNGPKGSPWAQKLLLGWAIIGQVCLDLVSGPVHIRAHRTGITMNQSFKDSKGTDYEVVPCPNQIKITDSLTQSMLEAKNIRNDIFHSSPNDNEVSLSCDDRKFLEIMDERIHKNEKGN